MELFGRVLKCIVICRTLWRGCQVYCDLQNSLVECQVHCDLQNSLAEFPSVLWFAELFGGVPKWIDICRTHWQSYQVYCNLQNSLAELSCLMWFSELFGGVIKHIEFFGTHWWSCRVYCYVWNWCSPQHVVSLVVISRKTTFIPWKVD